MGRLSRRRQRICTDLSGAMPALMIYPRYETRRRIRNTPLVRRAVVHQHEKSIDHRSSVSILAHCASRAIAVTVLKKLREMADFHLCDAIKARRYRENQHRTIAASGSAFRKTTTRSTGLRRRPQSVVNHVIVTARPANPPAI